MEKGGTLLPRFIVALAGDATGNFATVDHSAVFSDSDRWMPSQEKQPARSQRSGQEKAAANLATTGYRFLKVCITRFMLTQLFGIFS